MSGEAQPSQEFMSPIETTVFSLFLEVSAHHAVDEIERHHAAAEAIWEQLNSLETREQLHDV